MSRHAGQTGKAPEEVKGCGERREFEEFRDFPTDQLPNGWPLAAEKFDLNHVGLRQREVRALVCGNELDHRILMERRVDDDVAGA
jgi:hypothetical protein